ncbi:MAG TPA: serine hydrolase domain-containing protein, partial [Rhizomicrobium sp.]
LPDPVTLYLKISRDPDGKLVAAFRDPEQNSHGPAMQLLVSQEGSALRFSTWPDPQSPEQHLDATRTVDGIQIFWNDLNRTIVLTRLDTARSAPFYGRPPGSPPYVYRQPEETSDGWRTERAGALNMDEAALAKTVQDIIDIDPAAKRHSFQIHSIAIAYKGKLVLDEYFHGFTRDQAHDMRSASKTLASVMLGTAMFRGVKISPDTKAYTLLAPLGPFANPDPRKGNITIADFITHTPGLDCDDNNDADPNNEDHMESQRWQPDWRKFTLDLRATYTPGTHYAYCSGNINVVGGAISIATKTWLPEWFDETVARPLQFGPWYWNVMPNGEGYAGGGAFIRTRDFLKLGQTWLDGGMWNGRRIVSAAWVKDSVAPHRRVSPETTGRHGDDFIQVYLDGYDGYAWHLSDIQSGGRIYKAYFANGAGGQLLVAIPELDLACMFTAGNYGQGIWIYLRDSIVGKEIIPAIRT